MRRLPILFFALALSGIAAAAQPLVTPAELALLADKPGVRVVDIRDAKSYGTAHIPGAVSAPYGSWRGPATNPGELPPLARLTARVQSLGLTPQTRVIVVSSGADETDFGASARVYWTLKVLGFRELAILNGGMAAWSEAKLPQDANVVAVTPSAYQAGLDASLIATREETLAAVQGNATRLVDARPAAFFLGETRHQAAKLPGTLKGAVNVEHASWFKPGTATFVSADEAKRIAATKPLDATTETISFCNTGHWAATNWFALSEVLGQKNVKLYAGSMVDWTQAGDALPMDHVPNRLQQLSIDGKLWMERTFN